MSENEKQFTPIEPTEAFPVFEDTVVVEKKKPGKKGIIIGAAVLAAVIVIAAIIIGVVTSSPLGLIATGFQNSIEAFESNRTVSMLDKLYNGGSTEISMDLKTLLADSGLALDGTGSVKVYTDTENEKSVITLGVQLDQLQEMDASLYVAPDNAVLASQWLLGDKAYGITLQSFAEDFNKSVFRMDGPYSLGIELPENYQLVPEGAQKYAEDAAVIGGKMAAHFLKTFEENSSVEKAAATVTLGGEEIKTTAVTVSMDHQQLGAIAEDAIEYLRTDADFKKFMEENAEYMFRSLALAEGAGSAADYVTEFYQELDKAAAEMDQTKKDLEESNASLTVTFHITKSGKQLVGMDLAAVDKEEVLELRFFAGPDLKEAKEFRFYVNEEGNTYQGTYIVKVNDENTFVSLLDFSENGEEVLKADIQWDKQTGKLEIIGADEWDDSIVIQGSLEQAEEATTIRLDSVTADGVKEETGVTVVLRTSDEMPATPQYTELLKMTEAEVGSLVEGLGTVILQLMYGMM